MKKSNLILDLDGVLADFIHGVLEHYKMSDRGHLVPSSPEEVDSWDFFPREEWKHFKKDHNFWLALQPLNKANEILKIIPKMYLTARPVPSYVSREWLEVNEFPQSIVKSVKSPLDKIEILKANPQCILIDDHAETVRAVLKEGLNAMLFKSNYKQESIWGKVDHFPTVHSVEDINKVAVDGLAIYRIHQFIREDKNENFNN